MADERGAVEVRARAFLKTWHNETCGSSSNPADHMAAFAANFSLAENVEREKQLVGKNLIDVIGKVWLKLEQRAEAAEAEVVKLRGLLTQIVAICKEQPTKGKDWDQQWWERMNKSRKLAESALNPGAAKEGL